MRETSNRLISLLVATTVSATLTPSVRSETSVKSSTGSANYRDWQHFNPQKFAAPERLIPAASVAPQHSASYDKGVPAFPQDPTHANVIYGRGKDELPTAIYAKAFDVLQVGGKLFQAPAAGEVKHITVDGQGVAIYGTTVYTPLPNSAMVGNPVQVKPFDPSRIFYKDKDLWPAVIYAEPGKEITIANQKVVVPAAGQSVALIFDASGHLKQPAQQGTSSSENAASEKAAAEKAASEKAAAEKAAMEKAATEKAAAEKASAEKAAAEKAATEKAATEKAATEKAATEKAATEKATAEKAAAEKAAAEKAAAEKAAAEKAATEKASAEKAAADKTAAAQSALEAQNASGGAGTGGGNEPAVGGFLGGFQTGGGEQNGSSGAPAADEVPEELKLPPLPLFNIAGEWSTQNTTTSNKFTVKIDYSGTGITAVIVDQGSGYIPVGQVRFKGDYTSNPFSVTVQRAYAGYTNPYWEAGTVTVSDPMAMTVVARTGNLVLFRSLSSSAPELHPSPQSTRTSTPTVSVPPTTAKIPSQLKPVSRPYKYQGQTFYPSEEFTKKIENFVAGLPKSVQDWLVRNNYKIVAEVASVPLPLSWANTDTGANEIRFQEWTVRNPDPTKGEVGGFYETARDMDPALFSQGRHEVGHALGGEKGLEKSAEFLKAYNEDLATMDPVVKARLEKNYSDGHADGRSPFTNKESGADETMAQLIGYELNGRNQMSMDVHAAFKNSATLIQSKLPSLLK